jgi:hypothetical protein
VLPIGSGTGQIGVDDQPNGDCSGPEAIAFDRDDLLILDSQNRRVLRLKPGGQGFESLKLPSDLGRAIDLVAAAQGVFIADATRGAVVAVRADGVVAASQGNEAGGPVDEGRLTIRDGKVRFIGVEGEVAALPADVLGALSHSAEDSASGVSVSQPSPRSLLLAVGTDSFTLDGPDSILAATPLYRAGNTLLVSLDQSRFRGEDEVYFNRLVRWAQPGAPRDDAFAPLGLGRCSPNRSLAVDARGTAVFMSVTPDGKSVQVREAHFEPIGHQEPPLPSLQDTVAVSASAQDALAALQSINGVEPTLPVAAPKRTITRAEILGRAREALDYSWTPVARNLSNPKVKPVCYEGEHRWTLPPYLAGTQGRLIRGIPYTWGGYFSEMKVFARDQPKGRLTGSVCTCRNTTHYCLQQVERPIGLDCSGFVSYAWNLDGYHTTSTLPAAASPVPWNRLQPGDMLNKAGSHVMLIEKVEAGSPDPRITVIEAAKSCGKICRTTYTKARLMRTGYKPFTRQNVVAAAPSSPDLPAVQPQARDSDTGPKNASSGASGPKDLRPLTAGESQAIWKQVMSEYGNAPKPLEQVAAEFTRNAVLYLLSHPRLEP